MSDEKAAEKYADSKGNGIGDWYDRKYDFLEGCLHARRGEREMLKRLARYCYDNMSLYLSRDDDDRFVDEFLEQEANDSTTNKS